MLADGNLAWQGAEADIPVSPALASGLPDRACGRFTASLRLYQTETRQQPNRVWTFLYPTILVRDIEAPSARWTSVPTGWITSPGPGRVAGRRQRRLGRHRPAAHQAAGRTLYGGTPGDGAHIALLNLSSLPDGAQTLRLDVDGDGTAGAPTQEAPCARPDARRRRASACVGLPGGPRARDGQRLADPTSGVRDWTLRARGPDGPTVASWATGDPTRDLDLSAYAAPGETIRFVLDVPATTPGCRAR